MAKDKIKNSIWFVLFEGIRIYFSNIDKFFIYMLFPVLGQIVGIALTFGLTLGFADRIAQKTGSISSMLLMVFLLAAPGLLIFIKAFWDYMVAYVALNSMTEGAITTGKVYDFQSHREVATRRSGKYIVLLIAVGFLSLIGVTFCVIPFLGLILPLIFWIYFILVFQIFTFETEIDINDCFKRSFNLIKGDWARTFLLAIILGFFSIFIITEGVSVIFDCLHITEPLSSIFDFVGEAMPLDLLNRALAHIQVSEITVNYISKAILAMALSIIVSEFTLPIRSICWTLWYKNLTLLKNKPQVEKTKRVRKNVQV